MGFSDEYAKLRKKRIADMEEETTEKDGEYVPTRLTLSQQILRGDIAPVKDETEWVAPPTSQTSQLNQLQLNQLLEIYGGEHRLDDATGKALFDAYEEQYKKDPQKEAADSLIGIIGEKEKDPEKIKEREEIKKRTWFRDNGLFEDGWNFGDFKKTYESTVADVEENLMAGILGMGEGVVDAGAFLVGGVGGLFSKDFGDDVQGFIAKDLYDEKAIAHKIVNAQNYFKPYVDTDEYSVLGEKSEGVVQSGGQLLGTAALQVVGVPWWVTTGTTSFGGEVDNALNQGADYWQAGASGLVTAGSEILFEKLSGGISFGGKTLDDALTKQLATAISNKTLRAMAKFGMDATGEGAEEVFSQVISNMGTALYKDESMHDILFSEEALDGYIESFVGGAVLGGTGSTSNIISSSAQGKDSVTGLTANEENVFKKVLEEQLALAEKANGELTADEKTKLYDEVMDMLQNGRIDTDTIESVLGGETYKEYQDLVANEEAIQKEFDELGNLKKSDFTAKQDDRYNELKQKIDEMKKSNQRDKLKARLRAEVQKQLVRQNKQGVTTQADNYLIESYNERARRGQAFEADLTKYSEKQQEIVKKAVDSGFLNNTRKTHELVDMIAKIHEDKDVDFDFLNNERLKESSYAVNGKTVNGYYDAKLKKIGINIDSAKYLNAVVGHEVTHVLEGTDMYKELQSAIFEYAKTKGEYVSRRADLANHYAPKDIDTELTADLVGDYLFSDPDFVRNLSTKNRNVFQKIYDEIKYLCKVATAGSKEARQLEKVKHEFEKVYKEIGKASEETNAKTDVQHSLSDSNGKQLTKEQSEYFKDSKIRDENGNLLVMYHGTKKGGFNVFQNKRRPNTEGFYFTNDKTYSDTFEGKDGDGKYYDIVQEGIEEGYYSPETYEVYLDVKNPFVLTADQVDIIEDIGYWENIYKPIKNAGYDGVMMEDMSQVFVFNSNQIKRVDNTNPTKNADIRYSVSDSDGKQLTDGQVNYFKRSKMRDDNGNLMVMYHGSQDAGFHVFDPAHSDDETSLFFVDRNDVAASYSGTTETYEAQTIRNADDMNKFIESIGAEGYEVVEENGKFTLLYEGDRVADSNTADGIYNEFCWYEGVGEGDANYKVYLNLENPLVVDAEGRNWNDVSREFSQELADKYNSLTAQEKEALMNLASWEDISIFRDELRQALADTETGTPGSYDVDFARNVRSAYEKLGGNKVNMYDLFTIASDGFSAESINQFAVNQMTTRDYAQRAKEQGYDGVIFKNIHDNGGYSNGSEGASTVAVAFDSNQVKSVANENPTKNADIRYSFSEESDNVATLNGGSVSKYSLSTWTPDTQAKVRDNLIKAGYESYKVDKWIKDTNSVASVIAADKDRLDFVAADNHVMLKDNQDYIKTLDASTLCAKRLVYQGTFDAIQHRLPNTMFSSDDLIDLLNMMKEHGVQTPCGVCYVESRRRHLGKFAQDWLTKYNGEYKPNLDELTTSDGLETLRKSHPQTYKDFVDAMNKKGSSNPKVVQLRTEYNNDIMSLTPSQIRKIEAIGGLRVQSFSDFETPHMLDMMQAVMDMSAKGLHSQAYTKVPNFAWVFGDTGIKINLSLIAEGDGFDADGNLAFSSTEGMDFDEAMRLRDAYSQNVGTIIVGANDKHILACMADDRIDFIIPFHRSGWGMKELEMMGMNSYTDYTYGQKEHDLNKPTKVVNGVQQYEGLENLYPIDYWDYSLTGKENAERYLNLCAKTGREPKFSQFLVNNGDGSYSLQPDGSTDGYWKTLIDFKMYDNNGVGAMQQQVQPNFNMDEAYRVLNEYEGGANTLPVANDVVEEFVAKYQSYEELAPAMSLSAEGEAPVRYGNMAISGNDVRLEGVAPVREVVAKNATTTPTVSNMEQVDDFAPITEEEANEMQTQNIASLGDEDAPVETEAPYYEETPTPTSTPKNPFTDRDYTRVGSVKTKAFVEENPSVQPFFQEAAQAMLGDLRNSQKGQRWYNDRVYYESGGENGLGGVQRETTADIADLLDGHYHYTYQQIDDALNFIIHGEKLNACAKRIEFALNDRLLNGYTDINGMQIPPNQEYINALNSLQVAEDINNQGSASTFTDNDVPVSADDIAPVKTTPTATPTATQADIAPTPTETETEERVAQIRRADPKAKEGSWWSRTKKKVNDAIALVGDKGWAVENLAKRTNNRALEAKYDFYRNRSQGVAQEYINENLFPIWDKIESSGKREDFDLYAYHLHNIDRMSLDTAEDAKRRAELKESLSGLTEKQIESLASEKITSKTPKDRADMIFAAQAYVDLGGARGKNKAVFGESVTADKSRALVAELETKNPEFKEWEQEVIAYNKALREFAVKHGLISQKTADLWEKMYPHYVPISRIDSKSASVSVPLDSNKTGVNNPFKRAQGGSSDFEPLLETMAKNTEQIFRAVFRNDFGIELMNTLGMDGQSNEDVNPQDVLETVEEDDGAILKEGKNGVPSSFTVFRNGKRVSFDVPDDIFNAVKPTEGELAKTYAVLNKPSETLKKLNTEWKPTFALWRNPIKDAKDVLHNSQHATKTYLTAPEAIKEMATKGEWLKEYMANGGRTNTYYDSKTKTFAKKPGIVRKTVGFPVHAYKNVSSNLEMFWRFAEYIASRKEGRSIEVSMLDAARVTTNFGAGGDLTKYLNRNGAFFLNPSVQGAMQIGRNIREAHHKGWKGYAAIAGKVIGTGLGGLILNHLLWGDDEEYEELSDYVKQNYFIVAKTEDGKFIRIPKGRMEAVIQNGFEQMQNLITGDDEVDLETFAELVANNLAPNNPFENNIFSTINQIKNNETWYGEDLVPQRLQDLPANEQYDESTDAISKWLANTEIGKALGWSPYQINYLFQQYGGGVADTVLPMLTPESENGSDSALDSLVVAPWRDEIVTDGVLKNQNVSDFYDAVDELTKKANSMYATDDDILKSKYMNAINSELSELYKQKREIQNSDLPNAEKYDAVREIQKQIADLAKNGLSSYEDISYEGDGEYAIIGDKYFQWYTPENGEAYWRKLNDEQVVKYNLTKNAGNSHYVTDGNVHYRLNDDGEWTKISAKDLERQNEVTKALGITPDEYWRRTDITYVPLKNGEYEYAYDNPEQYEVAKAVGGYDAFKTYSSELYEIKADKDKNGNSISGSRKEKVIEYINNLDIDYGEKIILFKNEYNADDTYNYDIIDYLNSREDISYEQMETILKELGFTVDANGNISW